MDLLLDTHVYLWWLRDDRSLEASTREVIADPSAGVAVSAASVWEAGIKIALGRLDVGRASLVDEIAANGFLDLPIKAEHGWTAAALPPHHSDPFDRMLVAQALTEGLVLVTRDDRLTRYGVPVLTA
jgi:PIN domain nuclease of toxin-antitoxin system